MPDRNDEHSYGIEVTWKTPNYAVVTSQGEMSRQAINAWADTVIATIQTHNSSQPLFLLVDLTHPNQKYSLHGIERSRDVYRSIPHQKSVTFAVAVAQGPVHHLAMIFLTRVFVGDGVTYKVFGTASEAGAWLQLQHDARTQTPS